MSSKPATRRRVAGVFAALAIAALAVLSFAPTATASRTPEETVRTTAETALRILGDAALSNQQKTDALAELLDGVSDFETTSKLVIAQGWRSFSDTQKAEFQKLLRDYLIARYRSRVDDYAGQTVQILNGRDEARGDYTVNTRVEGGGNPPIKVAYRLRKDPQGAWRVIDVIGEDISIVSNLRAQFQSLLSRGGPEKLLQTLRDKIAKGDAASGDGTSL